MTRDASAARGPTTTRALAASSLSTNSGSLIAGQAQALALADGEMDDAVMAAQHRAGLVDDLAGPRRIGAQLFHDAGVAALRHEADVLAVGLGGRDQAQFGGEGAHLRASPCRPAESADSRAAPGWWRTGNSSGRAPASAAACSSAPAATVHAADIMAGGQRLGAQIARRLQQIGELHFLVAADAGDRRFAARIGCRRNPRSRFCGSGFRNRAHNGECRAPRRRAWRRRCPGRRSRRPSSSAPCRDKAAA